MHTKTSRKAGFTLTEIMIVVAIIGLLAAMAIPNFIRARQRAQTNACIDNLRLIDGAKQQWALELKKLSTDTPTDAELTPYLGRGGGQLPICPIGTDYDTSYTTGDVATAPTCKLGATLTPAHVLP